ncbi:MAG: type II secretion system protein GspG [Patescibacteria group bacterium]|mgnify:CR=1 FL=1
MDQPNQNPQNQNQGQDKPLTMPPGEAAGGIGGSNLRPPEPMGGTPSSIYPTPVAPAPPTITPQMEPPPKKGLGSVVLIILLIIILILGVLVFISWKGWISLGGLEKLWGGGQPTASPTLTPGLETTESPTVTTSPEITTNVNDQIRKSNLLTIKSALKKYYIDNSTYPESLNISKTSDINGSLAKNLIPSYLEELPDDPLSPQYWYGYKSDGLTFELTAVLEDKSDPEGIMSGSNFLYKITDSTSE